MKNFAKTSLAVLTLTLAAVSAANAIAIPEIDPATGTAGMTLLAGSIMVIRGLRKR